MPSARQPKLTRDQERARHAYARVGAVPPEQQKDYKVAVNDLGPNIMRSGLAVAMAWLERDSDAQAVRLLLQDLLDADVPGIDRNDGSLPDQVRALDIDGYLLASREMLRVATWFKRAVQARIED